MCFNKNGFTLIELMIVIAIIGILAILIVPSYQKYLRRAHYLEVIQAAIPLKIAVQECFQITSQLDSCGNGKHGVPSQSTPVGLIQSAKVSEQGKITITPQSDYGFTPEDTYILTPLIKEDQLFWTASGGGVERGYAR